MAVVEYIAKESFVHNLHPLTKLFWAAIILILSLLFNDYRYLAIILLSVIAVALMGKILRDIQKALFGLFLIAIMLFLLQIIFYQSGDQLFSWGWFNITIEGILFGIAITIRMLIMVSSFLVFFCTTQMRDIIMTLVEEMKVPYEMAFMFTTAVRFIPAFMGEAFLISQAQKARGYHLEGINPLKKLQGFMPVALPLVLISLKKAERLSLAMETRGFGSGPRTYYRQMKIKKRDLAVMITAAFILVLGINLRIKGYGVI